MSTRKTLTVHQKIMAAAARGTGLRLSADEVERLSTDEAIRQCAENDDEGGSWGHKNPTSEEMVFRPYKEPTP